MKFEYDPAKSDKNEEKHGISFEEVKKLWLVPNVELQARTVDEPRHMVIGKINGKFYSCIYTIRNQSIRLISARRSRINEENIYHEFIKN